MIRSTRFTLMLVILSHVGHAYAGHGQYQTAPSGSLQQSKTRLAVLVQTGPDAERWKSALVDTDPTRTLFRWRTDYELVGRAEWELSEDALNWKTIARGDARLSANNKQGTFSIDMNNIAGAKAQRPLQYYVRVVTYKSQRRATTAPTTTPRVAKPDSASRREAVPQGPRNLRARQRAGVPSPPLPLTYVTPGDITRFTTRGLDPGLLTAMPIEISLETVTIKGEGGDEDPYLFVVVMFADGTTIIPELDASSQIVRFTGSTVRLQSPTETHGNLEAENVDVGVPLDIPTDTGTFKTTIRPVGVQFFNQLTLSDDELTQLRENTFVGVFVIGMEEDAVPSTEAMNETRNDLVNTLQNELDELIRDVSVSTSDPTNFPDLATSAAEIAGDIRDRLMQRAKDRGKDEFVENLQFLGFPAIIAVPGALNADDYIGSRYALFSYEDILNSDSSGLEIDLQLNQRWEGLPRYLHGDTTEPIWYHVKGRIRRD